MIRPRLFLCSGVSVSPKELSKTDREIVQLDSLGTDSNVTIRIEDVAKVFAKDLSPRLIDLLEIAAYVYTADSITPRGNQWTDDYSTEAWDRDFHFVIPVRDLNFWNTNNVQEKLIQLLNFLSNDKYVFEFKQLKSDRKAQSYFDFGEDERWPFYKVSRVLMFSGGLDSLAGAVETASNGEKLVLVSHRPVGYLDSRQRNLFNELSNVYPNQMIHIPVWIYKQIRAQEFTQRTRSFLFSSLGVVVGESVKSEGVRFFENGIVSLNLPIADEVLRARASRTTHPISLELLSEFHKLVTERDFIIDNPYLFKTKADVVSVISDHKKSHLISYTCSCAHIGHFSSKTQWHCGTCSQCIDRRIAIIASGQEAYDPEYDYKSDVFIGPRQEGPERNMAVDYAHHARELYRMSEMEIATQFNLHLSRAVRYLPKAGESAQKLAAMHKRHGEFVSEVLEQQFQKHASAFFLRED